MDGKSNNNRWWIRGKKKNPTKIGAHWLGNYADLFLIFLTLFIGLYLKFQILILDLDYQLNFWANVIEYSLFLTIYQLWWLAQHKYISRLNKN